MWASEGRGEEDLSDSKCGVVVGTRGTGLNILQSADLLGLSQHHSPSWCVSVGFRKGKLVDNHKKAKVTQITSHIKSKKKEYNLNIYKITY